MKKIMNIPCEIKAGLSYEFVDSLPSYPAPDWVLKYRLINASGSIDIVAVNDNGDHKSTLTATMTAGYTSGTYSWLAYVTQGDQKIEVDEGTIEILPDILSAPSYDTRSPTKQILDALTELILRKSTKLPIEINIAGRTLKYETLADLIKAQKDFKRQYENELKEERIAQGLPPGGRILTRFI